MVKISVWPFFSIAKAIFFAIFVCLNSEYIGHTGSIVVIKVVKKAIFGKIRYF